MRNGHLRLKYGYSHSATFKMSCGSTLKASNDIDSRRLGTKAYEQHRGHFQEGVQELL